MSQKTESKIKQAIDVFKDGNAFEDSVRGKLSKKAAMTLANFNPVEVMALVNTLVNTVGDVMKFTEYQETERTKIRAKRDLEVKRIQSQKEIILAYLKMSFDERSENFKRLFSIVDAAIANGNTEQLAMGLDSINRLAAESPFKALANINNVKLALEDKDHEWDV